MKRIGTLITLLCFVACMLAACGGGGAPAGDIRVVFIPKVTGNAFFEAANDGAQAYAEKQGFTVNYQSSEQASIDDQIAIVQKAIEEKADAICISSLDATALDPVLKEAMAAGVKVVTWDSDVSGDARMLMVSQGTPEQLGTMLVEMGAKSLADRGKNPAEGEIRYAWHYSQEIVADQNSWNKARGSIYRGNLSQLGQCGTGQLLQPAGPRTGPLDGQACAGGA